MIPSDLRAFPSVFAFILCIYNKFVWDYRSADKGGNIGFDVCDGYLDRQITTRTIEDICCLGQNLYAICYFNLMNPHLGDSAICLFYCRM